jgi:hypothetical protein
MIKIKTVPKYTIGNIVVFEYSPNIVYQGQIISSKYVLPFNKWYYAISYGIKNKNKAIVEQNIYFKMK